MLELFERGTVLGSGLITASLGLDQLPKKFWFIFFMYVPWEAYLPLSAMEVIIMNDGWVSK